MLERALKPPPINIIINSFLYIDKSQLYISESIGIPNKYPPIIATIVKPTKPETMKIIIDKNFLILLLFQCIAIVVNKGLNTIFNKLITDAGINNALK